MFDAAPTGLSVVRAAKPSEAPKVRARSAHYTSARAMREDEFVRGLHIVSASLVRLLPGRLSEKRNGLHGQSAIVRDKVGGAIQTRLLRRTSRPIRTLNLACPHGR